MKPAGEWALLCSLISLGLWCQNLWLYKILASLRIFLCLLLSMYTLFCVSKCKDRVMVRISHNIDIFWVLSTLGVKYYSHVDIVSDSISS